MLAGVSEQFVSRVEADLRRLLPEEAEGRLLEAARHLVFAGGRRMRVRLVASCGALTGAGEDDLAAIAAATELIHVASLLHDDVVDGGTQRRGRATANVAFGNSAAVLSGDWVLANAILLLERRPALVLGAVRCVAEMSQAAIREVDGRGTLVRGFETWQHVAEGKTGALFGWCAQATALCSDAPELAPGLERFGRHLGVAFQLADDVSDLNGSTGKDRFSDLRSGTPSYPVLLAAREDPAFGARVEALWHATTVDEAEVAQLGAHLLETGAKERSLAALDAELDAALRALGPAASEFSEQFRALAAVFVRPLTGA
jgi:heptaprenyl diphosphate synthase